MKIRDFSRALAGVLFLSVSATPSFADNSSMTSGFPTFPQCQPGVGTPEFPAQWEAKTLLTPFDGSQLMFAQVAVDSVNGMMRVSRKGVASGATDDLLFLPAGGGGVVEYRIVNNGDGTLSCKTAKINIAKSTKTKWFIPSPNMLANQNCTCQAVNNVPIGAPGQGTDSNAIACQNGENLPNGGPPEYDWYWMDAANPTQPVRLLFSRNNNRNGWPVLGEYSMVHVTDFSIGVPGDLGALAQLCAAGDPTASIQSVVPQPQIAGVNHAACQAMSLPTWPTRVYSNGALTAVDGSFTQMAIYYDYTDLNDLKEVSRIRYPQAWPPLQVPAGFINDTRLTPGATLEINIMPGEPAVCGSMLKNVGIWHPNWPTRDGCGCKAGIAAGSPLNSGTDDLQAMSCYFAGLSRIDAWYTVNGQPKMFYESNAGDLDLIDYYAWALGATMPAGIFNYPSCAGLDPNNPNQVMDMGNTCNTCHGAEKPQ